MKNVCIWFVKKKITTSSEKKTHYIRNSNRKINYLSRNANSDQNGELIQLSNHKINQKSMKK